MSKLSTEQKDLRRVINPQQKARGRARLRLAAKRGELLRALLLWRSAFGQLFGSFHR